MASDRNSSDWHSIVQPESLTGLTSVHPRASSFNITWKLITNSYSWAPPQAYGIWSSGVGGQEYVSWQDSDARSWEALVNTESDPGARQQRKEGWERTEDGHLGPPPAGLTLSASGQAARAKEKAKAGAGFQNVVTKAPAFSSRPLGREAPPELSLDAVHLFCLLNIENDKTPYFSWLQVRLTKSVTVSELVFLKVWGLCISVSLILSPTESKSLRVATSSQMSTMQCQVWEMFYIFGLTWHLVWGEVSRSIL